MSVSLKIWKETPWPALMYKHSAGEIGGKRGKISLKKTGFQTEISVRDFPNTKQAC
jgi:hypothetical protein